jgi:ABC-2 type transport system ATP-binding protein
MSLIEVIDLTKRFGTLLAVDGVSFAVHPGEVVAFLGPNGAGKSTTMKMITGFLAPDQGRAKIAGIDVSSHTIAAQRELGYLPEGAPAYGEMTPASFLKFCANARGMSGSEAEKAIGKAVERTNLQAVLAQPIETLSKGFKRRVGLAQAIMHMPDVLIMDEPTDGLDPNQKLEVRNLIKAMAKEESKRNHQGKAIILSTHILEEVEAVCTRAIVIRKGKLVADATPQALLERSKYFNAVTLSVRASSGTDVERELANFGGVAGVARASLGTSITASQAVGGASSGVAQSEGRFTLFPAKAEGTTGAALAQRTMQACVSKGWQVESLAIEQGRLDDVFRDLTAG